MGPRRRLRWGLGLLAGLHLAAVFGGFLAPYDHRTQMRDLPFASPSRVRFVDAEGRLHLRPFVYALEPRAGGYVEDRSRRYPIRFLPRGESYEVAGLLPANRHLFGVDPPARIFLLGSDGYGRDQLARLLVGGRISLFAGLLAAAFSLLLGSLLGALAGYFGGWLDRLIMRLVELFLALPWLYLLLAVRAFLPLHISPAQAFVLLVSVIGVLGWALPARLVRGVVLSARRRDYVLAARGFGATHLHLLRRHVLPQASGVVLTQAAVLVPQFILAEVVLSFLGLGVGPPTPSWGNLLAELQRYQVLASYWWMTLPAGALVAVFLCYHLVARALHAEARIASS